MHRRHDHHGPPTSPEQVRDLILHGEEHAAGVSVGHQGPLLDTHVVHRLEEVGAGVVETDVEAAIHADNAVNERLHLVQALDIGLHVRDLAACVLVAMHGPH
jgi:hypothetical protein